MCWGVASPYHRGSASFQASPHPTGYLGEFPRTSYVRTRSSATPAIVYLLPGTPHDAHGWSGHRGAACCYWAVLPLLQLQPDGGNYSESSRHPSRALLPALAHSAGPAVLPRVPTELPRQTSGSGRAPPGWLDRGVLTARQTPAVNTLREPCGTTACEGRAGPSAVLEAGPQPLTCPDKWRKRKVRLAIVTRKGQD